MVYVDNARIPYRGMLMCHMIADSLQELHNMATSLKVRKYFQDKPNKPHYDICLKNRNKAILLGAVEIESRDLILKLRSSERV